MVHTHGLRPDNPKSYPFAGGTTAVEFFLILSGYFVMQSMIETNVEPQDCGKISLQFTWKRFRSIFFYVLCSVILQYSVEAIVQKESFYTIAKNFLYSIFEITLLPMSGIYQTFFDSPLWYLSSFFLVLPLFQYLLLRYRNFMTTIFLVLAPLIIYGHFFVTYGELDKWNVWYGFFYVGTLRVIAGLSVGGLCFFAVSVLKKLSLTKIACVLISITQIFLFAAILFFCYRKGHTRIDFILVSLISILLIFTLSAHGPLNQVLQIPVFSFLGKLSVPLFTSHWSVRRIVPYLLPKATYEEMVPIYLAISIILAIFLLFVKSLLDKKEILSTLKKHLLSSDSLL